MSIAAVAGRGTTSACGAAAGAEGLGAPARRAAAAALLMLLVATPAAARPPASSPARFPSPSPAQLPSPSPAQLPSPSPAQLPSPSPAQLPSPSSAQLPASAAAARPEVVAEVRVHGNHSIPDADIQKLAGVALGDPVGPDTLDAIAARLRASGRFESVEVRKRYTSLVQREAVALILLVRERPGAADAARGGHGPRPRLPGAAHHVPADPRLRRGARLQLRRAVQAGRRGGPAEQPVGPADVGRDAAGRRRPGEAVRDRRPPHAAGRGRGDAPGEPALPGARPAPVAVGRGRPPPRRPVAGGGARRVERRRVRGPRREGGDLPGRSGARHAAERRVSPRRGHGARGMAVARSGRRGRGRHAAAGRRPRVPGAVGADGAGASGPLPGGERPSPGLRPAPARGARVGARPPVRPPRRRPPGRRLGRAAVPGGARR